EPHGIDLLGGGIRVTDEHGLELADGLVQLRQLGRHDEDLAAAALAEHADRTVDEPLAIDVEQRLRPTHATRPTCGEDQAVGSPGVSKRHRISSGTASRLPSS